MSSSKIIPTDPPYSCVQLEWNRKKAKSVFTDLKEICQNYEWGVDEEQELYFRPISNEIIKRYWISKGVRLFEPDMDVDNIINEYDVLIGKMTSGDNYLLTVKDAGEESSQEKYGIRKDNLQLPECIPGFGSDLALNKTPPALTTNPEAGTPANMTDGNSETEWDSGANQAAEHYIQVDLGEIKSYLGKVRVDSVNSAKEKNYSYADRFKILISSTGEFDGEETEVFATVEDFGTADVMITFSTTAGRYVRVELTSGKDYHWRVNRFEIYEHNVADITRWATSKLNEVKDPVRRGVLELDSISERILPRGKIRLTSQDGGSYFDYPVKATRYHLSADMKLGVRFELGKMEKSFADQLLKQRRMLQEFAIAGLSRDADLSSGAGIQQGGIKHTHIGRDSIETPMLRAKTIRAEHYQELRNTYVFSDQDSLDANDARPFEMDFSIVSEMTAIQSVKLSFRIRKFRAYATGLPSGGGHTTPSGGGATSGSRGTPSGGGSTSGSATHNHPGSTATGGGHSHGLSGYDYHTSQTDEHDHLYNRCDAEIGDHSHSLNISSDGAHSHSTPNHTHPNHTHSTPSHTHTVRNHTHSLSFGIYEETTSPTIHYHVDNGAGYGGASANYTTDQLDLDITALISGTGFKRIMFHSTARARISAWVLCKVDLTA